ncbi:Cut9-interacting protein scn1 [Neophaeococcomyces mojaviensis]|uniref:Cut9-interacting protein scn1 n=1 Tax=Neophaeococcomyces mojaviensis TaxID=3383035 RepID=A0ACC2ZT78_9EURO|nr:Cut9-interacting protein scn1 [Knufia sp. JES_112]
MPGKNERQLVSAHQIGLFDAHCHPTDIMSAVNHIEDMKAKVLTIMATRAQDQDLVLEVAKRYPVKGKDDMSEGQKKAYVVPSFGWHPWFAHQIYDDRESDVEIDAKQHYRSVLTPPPDDDTFLDALPSPRPLTEYIRETEQRLNEFSVALVGEIGLDRSFRVPLGSQTKSADTSKKSGGHEAGEYTAGSREGRPLSPHYVSMNHQKVILKAQLELAARMKRAVSVHSVATHGVIFDLLQSLWKGHEKPSKAALKKQKKDAPNTVESEDVKDESQDLPYPPRICMHSYSGPADALKQFLNPRVPADMFFSFSECINFASPASNKVEDVIKAVPDDKILIESDLHCAGDIMDGLLEDVLLRVCDIKGWSVEKGAHRLRDNWMRFVFGP